MLRRDGTQLAFRHELSQRALLASMTPADRANMHGRALAVLREREPVVEVAELAHHTSAAGDAAAVLEYAPLAGARASALGAHRAARAHYENASRFLARLPVAERATLLERHAYECYLTEELQRAMASQEAAVSCWREVGEVSAEGRCLAVALYMTWIGESEGVPSRRHHSRGAPRVTRRGLQSGPCLRATSPALDGDRVQPRSHRMGREGRHIGRAVG